MQAFTRTVDQQQEGSSFKNYSSGLKAWLKFQGSLWGNCRLRFDVVWSCSLPGAAGKSPKRSVSIGFYMLHKLCVGGLMWLEPVMIRALKRKLAT